MVKGDAIPVKTTILDITPLEFLCMALHAQLGTSPGELVVTQDFCINTVAESAMDEMHTVHISVVDDDEPISNQPN